MYQLNLNFLNLLLIFYIYCFFGWCFESTYVSIKSKKWVNRGFMHSPFLPIYGSGAVVILYSTIPVMKSPVLVYILSVFSATVLELVTGWAMESLFKVKYWDYSKCFMNFKGYICLKSSVTWGFMGLLVTYIINEPIAHFLDNLNVWIAYILAGVLSLIFIVDLVKSFKEAYDVRTIIVLNDTLMKELKEVRENIEHRLEEYIEDIEENTQEAIEEIKAKIDKALSYTEIDDIIMEKFNELKNMDMDDHIRAWKSKKEDMKQKFKLMENNKRNIVKRHPSANSRIAKEIREFMKEAKEK